MASVSVTFFTCGSSLKPASLNYQGGHHFDNSDTSVKQDTHSGSSGIFGHYALSLAPIHASYNQRSGRFSSVKFVSVGMPRSTFPSLRLSRFHICCAAKPETVAKVVDVVKKQLALSEDVALTPESTFASLGADSLDTVEIVMGLEEEFGITIEEDNSQTISTVQDAADLIDKLVGEKANAA